jgi:hypothetical protein
MFKVLLDPFQNRAFRAHVENHYTSSELRDIRRGVRAPSRPIELTRAEGREFRDVIWTTFATTFFISRRVVGLLTDLEASGWTAYDNVVVVGHPDRTYFGLSIKGRCAPLDPIGARIVIKDYPGGAFPIGKGLGIDPDQWDGSDLFMADDHTGWLLVSDRVASGFADFGITNVEFTDSEEIELP